ncbi:putative receptor-like serine/threonine-protein kinase [Quercus suber]|uniref:non-specific serine/threonine protein kinase n=1 Tax=Quercus suber TaxID=58331 RepID=A0AAW0KST0_QUESU
MNKAAANTSLLEEIIDPMLQRKYNIFEMKALVQVALQCVEEDKDVRPTMSQVVEMLLLQEKVSDGHKRLVTLLREKMNPMLDANISSIEEIVDPMLEGKYDIGKMETLVGVALQRVAEDKDARPTMSQVVEMLLGQKRDS